MKSKRFLVTGGAGFIGSHLVERLISDGHIVTVIDNLSRGSIKNIRPIANVIRFKKYDLRKMETIVSLFRNQDIVINLAAVNTGVDFDIGRTEYMFEENMLLQMNPLKAAFIARVKKFIQVSSASIYSKSAMENRIPTNENDDGGEPEPSKLGYSYAKRMGEKLALWYNQNTNMRTIVARPINVYGKRDNFDNKGHFIPCMIKKFLIANNYVEVFGSGKQCRSYVAVEDLVEALLLLVLKGRHGEIYNIDAQDEHSVREIVTAINLLIPKKANIKFNRDLPEGSKRRMLSNRKIKLLGWKPQYKLVECLSDIIEDIQERMYAQKSR